MGCNLFTDLNPRAQGLYTHPRLAAGKHFPPQAAMYNSNLYLFHVQELQAVKIMQGLLYIVSKSVDHTLMIDFVSQQGKKAHLDELQQCVSFRWAPVRVC